MSLEESVPHSVRMKLKNKHNVSIYEVEECFSNREGSFLEDTREKNKTNPPTNWFIAETDYGRKLKVVFIELEDRIELKTAYEPNQEEIRIYQKYAY
ncbi:ADP-ribosyl-(dinitrogen reductase) hydrolase [Pseudoalteromonas sp. C12FD-1]|uniref:ADP-ribosyl-(dinitrogen reductase) hydrolase n=1 Tax=Pseudoalteromonas sp. C12FD-1 TaxID=3131979 RepID=UPI00307F6848